MDPEVWIPPPLEIRRLQSLVKRADALIVMRTQEQNRLDTAHETIESSIKEHIVYLDQEIEKLKRQIADQLKPAQRTIIRSHGPLAMKDADAYSRLITAAVKNTAFPFLPK